MWNVTPCSFVADSNAFPKEKCLQFIGTEIGKYVSFNFGTSHHIVFKYTDKKIVYAVQHNI